MSDSTYDNGHLVVSRYEIQELVGTGATVEVYRAIDRQLGREVALEALRPYLRHSEEVRRQFRSQIVRSASLSHSHLARVYDGGQSAEVIFLVGEFLRGGSLDDLLTRGAVLSPSEVARLGRDVAQALAYLHDNDVVHGELSPHKLLFDGDGRVKIVDVAISGLHRERQATPWAAVRYLSPEQMIGQLPVAASDVYTLALILFEMATGTSPVDGQSIEDLRMLRQTLPLPARPELGVLDIILAQASTPDPLVRLTAAEFAQRLGSLIDSDEEFRRAPEAAAATLLGSFDRPSQRSSIGFRPPSTDQVAGRRDLGTVLAPRSLESPLEPLQRTRRSTPRPLFLVASVLIVVLLVGGGAAWKLGWLSSSSPAPNVVGLTLTEASQLVKSASLTLSVTAHVPSSTVAVGDIISQSPVAQTKVNSGSTLAVVVSSGVGLVTLPTTLIAKSCAADQASLLTLTVIATCPTTARVGSTTVATGLVAQLRYQGQINPIGVPRHANLVLVLSSGPGPGSTTSSTVSTTTAPTTTTTSATGARPVPNVVGDDQSQVYDAMHSAALYYSTTGPGHGTAQWKRVVSQNPVAGTVVPWHSEVTLTVTE